MKKVIFIHLLNDYSGSPKVLSQVIESCQKAEIQMVLYTSKNTSGFLSDLMNDQQYYFYKRFENRYLTLLSYILSQILLFFKLLKHINKDVVIYVNTMLPFGAGLAGFVMGKPVYYHVHETYLSPPILKYFLRSVIQLAASKVVFVSNTVKTLELFKHKEQQVIYNAVPKEFSTLGYEHKLKSFTKDAFVVLMISSLKSYKGVNEFVMIADLLRINSDIKFTLVLNAEQTEIDNYFAKIQLPSNLKIVAKTKDVIKYYQKSSLVVNLSKIDECIETFGLTIMEAMSFGIPVIVPPVGGPAEIVRDGIEGYLISSYDTSSIVDKINELFNDKVKYDQLSENAFKRASDFDEETFRKEILQVINE